ncbi:MAG: DUF4432 family protein [Alphaproteobacteria bacterium]|nr:DUF4432 family protein [Alphaproteobacteria bacterium]
MIRAQDLRPYVADLRQFAWVRRITLDDGPERGVRALAFNTGGGLDFWVLADRTMDIGPLNWRGSPIAWQTPMGFRSPALTDLEGDGGFGFLRSFSGMLVTCGLDHVRGPKDGKPLHGRGTFTPARLLSYGEDWDNATPLLYCTGEIDQAIHLGESLRLTRRIEAPIGGTSLKYIDRVTNLGPETQEHQLLYHINFGWPALSEGSILSLNSHQILPPFEIVRSGGARSTVSFPASSQNQAEAILTFPSLAGKVSLRFHTDTLPILQVWRDPRAQRHVMALEPCSSDRDAQGASVAPIILAPGESRDYCLEMTFALDSQAQT